MPFVPFNNVVMAEMRMTLDGQRCENTLYFQRESPWSLLTMEALSTELINWWESAYAPYVADNVSLNEVYITDLSDEDALALGFTDGLPIPGELLSPPLPNNVSFTISLITSNRGRSARGRNYIVGLVEEDVTDNQLSVARADALADGYAQLITRAAANDCTWVVASRYANQEPRVVGQTYLIRQARYADLVVDSQRRRLPGRGL